MTIWPILAGALILLAMLGRIPAQSGYDRGFAGVRPSVVALIGTALLCAMDLLVLAASLPIPRWIVTMADLPIPLIIGRLMLMVGLSFLHAFPAEIGMPPGMIGGFVVGRMKHRRAVTQ